MIPFSGKVEFEPITVESAFSSEGEKVSVGKILNLGFNSIPLVKVGDIIHFMDFGAESTISILDGKEHWFLEIDPRFVIAIEHV
jgi:co-chaperonin GroES (HSP10)